MWGSPVNELLAEGWAVHAQGDTLQVYCRVAAMKLRVPAMKLRVPQRHLSLASIARGLWNSGPRRPMTEIPERP